MDLVVRDHDDDWTQFTTVATGLNLKQWYTIKVVCDVETDTAVTGMNDHGDVVGMYFDAAFNRSSFVGYRVE